MTSQMTYSGNLHSLADDMTGLDLTLILRDVRVPELDVQLRFYLTGPGLSMETRTDISFAPIPLVLNEPTRIMGADLFEYFLPQSFTNPPDALIQSGGQLPEGMYTICVEVVSLNRLSESVLSDRICTLSDMDLLDPPKITSPYDGELILDALADFQLPINFSWLMNYSNLVFPIDYYLYIYEYDEQIMEFGLDLGWDNLQPFFDPVLVQSSEFLTSYLFNGSEAVDLMEVGQRYIVRVQATSMDENVFIRNEGYSDPVIFQYGSLEELPEPQCAAPEITTSSKALSDSSYTVSWDEVALADSYDVLIWNDDGSRYDSLHTTETTLQLTGFDPELRYEGYVVANCESGERVPSQPFFISLNHQTPTIVYNCGVPAEPLFNGNRDLLPALQVTDTVIAGDFKVGIESLTGPFTGTGVMIWNFPIQSFLTDAEPIAVNVTFENIKVNTDYQMFDGVMKITGAGIALIEPELAGFLSEFADQDYSSLELVEPPTLVNIDVTIGDVSGISVSAVTGEIVIVGSDDVIAWDQNDLEIVDAEGNVYAVDEDGNVVAAGTMAAGGPPTSTNTDGVDDSGTVQELTKLGVTFSNGLGNQYDYDEVGRNASAAEKALYFPRPIAGSGESYSYVHKAVLNGSSGETVIATVDPSIDPSSIIFKTGSGRQIQKSDPSGQKITLTLPGIFSSAGEDILATQEIGDGKQAVVGVMQVNYLPGREVNVVAVPVNGGSVPSNLSSTLQDIYGPAGVTYSLSEANSVSVGIDFLGSDNVLEGDGTGIFNVYTSEQKALNEAVKGALGANYDPLQTYYLLFPDFGSSADLAGNMPLNRQFGYVFPDGSVESKGSQAQTAAHEIGHGVFRLEHPFTRYELPEGSTDWLMDYSAGVELPFVHWNQIYDPELRLYAFQGEEESAAGLLQPISFTDTEMEHVWESTRTFVTPAGKLFSISAGTAIYALCPEKVQPRTAQGTLLSFTQGTRQFKAWHRGDKFVGYAEKLADGRGDWQPSAGGETPNIVHHAKLVSNNDPDAVKPSKVQLYVSELNAATVHSTEQVEDFVVEVPYQSTTSSGNPVESDRTCDEVSSVRPRDVATNNSIRNWKPTNYENADDQIPSILPEVLDFTSIFSDQKDAIANAVADEELSVVFTDEETDGSILDQIRNITLAEGAVLWVHFDYSEDKYWSELLLPEYFAQSSENAKKFYWESLENLGQTISDVNDIVAQVSITRMIFGTLKNLFTSAKIPKHWWDASDPAYPLKTFNDWLPNSRIPELVAFTSGFWNDLMDNVEMILWLGETSAEMPHKIIELIVDAEARKELLDQVQDLSSYVLDENKRAYLKELLSSQAAVLLDAEKSKIEKGDYTGVAYVTGYISCEIVIAMFTAGIVNTAVNSAKGALLSFKVIRVPLRIVERLGRPVINVLVTIFRSGYEIVEQVVSGVTRFVIKTTQDGVVAFIDDLDQLVVSVFNSATSVLDEIIFPPELFPVAVGLDGQLIPVKVSFGKLKAGDVKRVFIKGAAAGGDDLVKLLMQAYGLSSARATQLAQVNDAARLLNGNVARAIRLLDPQDVTKFFDDVLGSAAASPPPATLGNSLERLTSGWVDAWKVLVDAGRTGGNSPSNALTRNIGALESLARLRSNSKLLKLGITDSHLGSMLKGGGWGGKPNVPSYRQLCDNVNELIQVLPENTGSNLADFLGNKGFGIAGDAANTRRHSYVQLQRLLENKSLLSQADAVVFERRLVGTINSTAYESFSDVYVKIGNRVVEIETKAGTEFFANVAGSSSNFAKQSYNSLKNVSDIENYKVFLRQDLLETLDISTAKAKVIKAWTNFENGAILADAQIRNQFTGFARVKLNNPNIATFSRSQLESFLKKNDDWFMTIFQNNF